MSNRRKRRERHELVSRRISFLEAERRRLGGQVCYLRHQMLRIIEAKGLVVNGEPEASTIARFAYGNTQP